MPSRRHTAIALAVLAWNVTTWTLATPRPHASSTLPGWFGDDGAPPRRIAGRLLERGVPVTGTVHLRIDAPDPTIWTGLDVETGPDGAFDFGELRPGAYRVLATSADRASRVFEIDTTAAPADALSIYTAPCTMIRGRTVASGAPVAGARVELAGVLLATSDADGGFAVCSSLEWSGATIRALGYARDWMWLGDRGAAVQEIELRPTWPVLLDEVDEVDEVDEPVTQPSWRHPATISGTITHHGKPLPDALVEMADVFVCAHGAEPPPLTTRTGADGSFELRVPRFEPDLRIEITDAWGLHASRTVAASAGSDDVRDLSIEVHDNGSIAGTVARDGGSAPHLEVRAAAQGLSIGRSVRARVGDDGRFSIDRLEVGHTYDVTFKDGDTGRRLTRTVRLDAAQPDVSGLDADLSARPIEGHAVDELGAPVIGAVVTVSDEQLIAPMPWIPDGVTPNRYAPMITSSQFASTSRTDTRGRFTRSPRDLDGPYAVMLIADDGRIGFATVPEAGGGPVTVTMRPAGSLHVVCNGVTPLPDTAVELRRGALRLEVACGATVHGLAAGRYQLRAQVDLDQLATATVEIAPGARAEATLERPR